MRSILLPVAGIFAAAFLTMHAAAMLTADLPYFTGACIVSASVLGVLLWAQYRFFGDSLPTAVRHTGLQSITAGGLAPGLVIAAALLLSYPVLGRLTGAAIVPTDRWAWNLAGTFLTGGLAEEALFRGFLFSRLRRVYTFRRAALISAGFFTLAHLLLFTYLAWPIALLSTLLAAGTAVPLAYLFERGEGTIWSPALVHTAIRTIGVVFTASENYPLLAAAWMLSCLVVPYLVLLFYPDFRRIWPRTLP